MLASARWISRCRQTPRANTVRPYSHRAVVCRGRRPRRPVQFCVIAKFTVYRRGGFHIRPGSLAQAPNRKEGSRPLPTDQHKYHSTTQIVTPQNPPGRRGRRPLQPNGNKQQRIEIVNNPTVECWPRAGASPSALGFLRETARSAARAAQQSEPFPLSRDCAVAKQSKPQWGFEAHERASSAGWRRSLCAAKRAPRK